MSNILTSHIFFRTEFLVVMSSTISEKNDGRLVFTSSCLQEGSCLIYVRTEYGNIIIYFMLQCSVTCDKGQRSREVLCINTEHREVNTCDNSVKPSSTEECGTTPCNSFQSGE
jgi:hypothetical protein